MVASKLGSGGVGPSRSRFRFSAAVSRNKVLSLSFRLGGASLRCHQRGREGGIPFVDPLYRSPVLASSREVSSLAVEV